MENHVTSAPLNFKLWAENLLSMLWTTYVRLANH